MPTVAYMEKEANIKKARDGKRLFIPCPKHTVILISKSYRPSARGYVIYSPRASVVHLSFVFQHSMLALVGFTSFSAF